MDVNVFISYSWDSVLHREKVKQFVENLKNRNIKVIYDEDLALGERLNDFMVDGINNSNIVFFICTPAYKKKADLHKEGVGFENTIITSELYRKCNESKFIPILFLGTWENAIPNWAYGKKGIDLNDWSKLNETIDYLVESIKKLCNADNEISRYNSGSSQLKLTIKYGSKIYNDIIEIRESLYIIRQVMDDTWGFDDGNYDKHEKMINDCLKLIESKYLNLPNYIYNLFLEMHNILSDVLFFPEQIFDFEDKYKNENGVIHLDDSNVNQFIGNRALKLFEIDKKCETIEEKIKECIVYENEVV